MSDPRQTLDTNSKYSQVQLVFECPLGEECEELKEGMRQSEHEQDCNEDLAFNTLGSSYFVADDWQKARAGDILTMIDIRAYAELQEKLRIAEEALEFYASKDGLEDWPIDAREALAKIRGE